MMTTRSTGATKNLAADAENTTVSLQDTSPQAQMMPTSHFPSIQPMPLPIFRGDGDVTEFVENATRSINAFSIPPIINSAYIALYPILDKLRALYMWH